MHSDVLLAGACRTPIGAFQGSLSEVPPQALGATVLNGALGRAGVDRDRVDEVIMGNVLSAGLGQNVARQIALGAGLPDSVPATTVNKVCGSGLKAVMLATQAVRCGDASIVAAGGVESMSRAPYLLTRARTGYRMGDGELVDVLIRDGLWDAANGLHMGTYGDRCAEKYGLGRTAQDDYAVSSYTRARRAAEDGIFATEIVPVTAPEGKVEVTVADDEGPRRFSEEKMRGLRPAFAKDGTVTAGNASSINDGAAAVLVLSEAAALETGVAPQARILGYASSAREPEWFTLAPIAAIRALLDRTGIGVDDVDLWEINEAFSVVPMAAAQDLGIEHDRLNILGGAVALGHPIGASGTRTLVTLITALEHRGARLGVTALCIGGGEAVAMAIERVD